MYFFLYLPSFSPNSLESQCVIFGKKLNLYLPTISSSLCVADGLIFVQMSRVNTEPALLNTDVSDDIIADIITAIMRPRNPNDREIKNEF